MNAYPNEDSCVLITKMECSSPPCLQQQSRQKCSSYGYFSSLFWRYYCNTFMCFLSRTAFLQIRGFFFFLQRMKWEFGGGVLHCQPCPVICKQTRGQREQHSLHHFIQIFFSFPCSAVLCYGHQLLIGSQPCFTEATECHRINCSCRLSPKCTCRFSPPKLLHASCTFTHHILETAFRHLQD